MRGADDLRELVTADAQGQRLHRSSGEDERDGVLGRDEIRDERRLLVEQRLDLLRWARLAQEAARVVGKGGGIGQAIIFPLLVVLFSAQSV
jgi:hypothetical protein